MDDYTWNERMEKRWRRRKQERMFLLFVLVLFLGFGLWRFFYASTPEYALEQAYEAVQNKDVETFNKYVDLDAVTGRAYEDLTRDMFAGDKNLSDSTKVMFEVFYQKIKPQVVSGTNELLKKYVENGEWQPPQGDDILKGRQLGIDYEYLIQRSQLRNTEVVKIGDMQKNDRSADAVVEVRDVYTDTHYTVHLMLEPDADGVWRVVYISNYRDYLNLLEPLQNSDINKYVQSTQGIVDEYNSILSSYQNEFGILTATSDGEFSELQRNRIVDFLATKVIPAFTERQVALNGVAVPEGASYLHKLRQKSTELTVKAWEHYIAGLKNDSPAEINESKALYKEAMDVDNRINDILKHTAVSQAAPYIQ